jgi:hypothetical protein
MSGKHKWRGQIALQLDFERKAKDSYVVYLFLGKEKQQAW